MRNVVWSMADLWQSLLVFSQDGIRSRVDVQSPVQTYRDESLPYKMPRS
jgi:hypothetical protein